MMQRFPHGHLLLLLPASDSRQCWRQFLCCLGRYFLARRGVLFSYVKLNPPLFLLCGR